MRRSAIGAAVLACTLVLAGCSGAEESPTTQVEAVETPAETASPAPSASPAETAPPKYPTGRQNIRVTIAESFPVLLSVNHGNCVPHTSEGALKVAYTALDGSQVLLGLSGHGRLDSDLNCEVSYTAQGVAPLDPEKGAHLVQVNSAGNRKLAPMSEVNEVIGGWSLHVEITDELLASVGIPTEERATQVNLVNAVRDAGYAPTSNPTANSIVEWAQSECAEWSEKAADDDPDALLAHLILFGKPTGDRLAAEHMCPEHLGVVELAQRSFDGGVQVVTHEPDPSEREIRPGTYRTVGDRVVTDCYWERATGSGDIIANDFITAAVDGVRVTVNAGETFISRECGPWAPVQ